MIEYPIVIGEEALGALEEIVRDSRVMVIVDENTREHCYPLVEPCLGKHSLCTIQAGEKFKNLDTCVKIWNQLTEEAFDRKGIIVNLGGGVIGDMGGFVAGTYKRGMRFVQMPTTLLSQVDASVGSKLGIDFQGYKNHIGLFRNPEAVLIDPKFLDTLSERELISGFAEVIKHHLIADKVAWEKLKTLRDLRSANFAQLIQHSVDIKAKIVKEDPFEHGARKALNFGHTIGHAVESTLLESEAPLLHGEAIAIGMICEAFLSFKQGLITEQERKYIEACIQTFYPQPKIKTEMYEEIFQRSLNDKKNRQGKILCTFLEGIGAFRVNQEIRQTDIFASIDHYNAL